MRLDIRHYLIAFVMGLLGIAVYWAIFHVTYPLNQNVTQTSVNTTICVKNWTGTVRPPTSFTTPLKAKLCAAQKCGNMANYELDHFVAIEIGGAPADPNNLVLQAYPEAHNKDAVENYLHKQICNKSITLKDAQAKIYNWKVIYQQISSKFGGVQSVDASNNEDD